MNRGGFVYVMALLVVLVVSGIAMLMANSGGLRLRADAELSARGQCRDAALGVLRAVVNDLRTSMAAGHPPGLVTVRASGETIGACTVVLIGRDATVAQMPFGLIAEAGRIDVNHAPAAVLAALPNLDAGIAAAIVDWRDADDTVSDGGAERSDGAYAGAAVPYAPRNAPFETLSELRLVRGVTDAMWFGEDANRNGRLDPGEDANGNGRLDPGLVDLLTLESREPANAPDGTARTSTLRFGELRTRLVALFGTERGAALATAAQAAQPFANRLELCAALELKAGEAASLWPCIIGPEGRVGLLDAATASEEALTAAVGTDLAGRIISARPVAGASGDPAWLVTALGRDASRVAGLRLTCGSYSFRVDLLAVRNDGAGWARLDAVIDCSSGQVKVVEIHPAEASGWPLPAATLARLRTTAPSDVASFLASGPSR